MLRSAVTEHKLENYSKTKHFVCLKLYVQKKHQWLPQWSGWRITSRALCCCCCVLVPQSWVCPFVEAKTSSVFIILLQKMSQVDRLFLASEEKYILFSC